MSSVGSRVPDHKFAPAENGFFDRDDSALSFVDGTRTFSITPVGGSFAYMANGGKYTKTSADSLVIADTEGLHFIYYDGATLGETTTFTADIITDYAFVAAIYWDATNNAAILFGDERHGATMDSATHSYNHNTFGARYSSGLALGDMDVDGSGNDASAAQFSVADGVIYDEDIRHAITDDDPQDLSTTASIPIFYRTGADGDWRRIAATDYPITTTGTGRAAWNELTGGSWQLTEAGNSNYVLMHYYATGDTVHPIIGLVGQAEYSTRSAAREAATTELLTLATGGLTDLTLEFVPIATAIWQTASAYSNAVNSRVVSTEDGDDYIDWRSTRGAAAGGVADDTSPFGRVFSVYGPVGNQTFKNTLGTQDTQSVNFTTTTATDTGFSWSAANNELTCSFDGRALVSWSVNAEWRVTGTRSTFEVWLEVDTGGGYAIVTGTQRNCYIRQSTSASTASLSPFVVDVSSGDKFRVRAQIEENGPYEAQILQDQAHLTIQRIQGAS